MRRKGGSIAEHTILPLKILRKDTQFLYLLILESIFSKQYRELTMI